jgi:ATP-dependent exoDNAse (exonuclease V) alpha subunit
LPGRSAAQQRRHVRDRAHHRSRFDPRLAHPILAVFTGANEDRGEPHAQRSRDVGLDVVVDHRRLFRVHLEIRQRDPEERRALGQLHAGNVETYLRFAEQRNRISYGAELTQAVEHYSTDVAKLGQAQVAFVCPTNALARAANDLVRERRRAAGELGEETTIGELDVSVGDRVVCRRNHRRCDVINSDRGTVTRITVAGLDVELDDGRSRHLPRSYAEAGDLQLGYAGTVHVHQGCTVERTIIAARPDELYGELTYVAASRARDTTHFHLLDDPRPGDLDRAEIGPVSEQRVRDQRKVLIAAMGESHAEELASEMLALTQERGKGLGREL